MSSSMCLLEQQGMYGEVWAEGGQGHWVNIASTSEPSTSKALPPAEISLGFFLTSHQIKQKTMNVRWELGKIGGLHLPCLHPPSVLSLKSTLLLCISNLYHG